MKLQDLKNQYTEVELADGKKHKLIFDMNAIEVLEETFGNLEEAFRVLEELEEKKKTSPFKHFLRALLMHEFADDENDYDKFTSYQAGKLFNLKLFPTVLEALTEAIQLGSPDSDEEIEEKKPVE